MLDLAKQMVCVQIRSGVEIWIEKEVAVKFQSLLEKITMHKFISLGDESINTADIVGIFSPQTMEATKRHKLGQWLCKEGNWHSKSEDTCLCSQSKYREEEKKKMEKMRGDGNPISERGLKILQEIKDNLGKGMK